MDAFHVSDSAGRLTGDSSGTLRSRFDRRLEAMANVSACDFAAVETGNFDRPAVADNGSAARVRSDIHPDRRWARFRDRNCESIYLSHRVSLFQLWVCGRDVVRAVGDHECDQCGIYPAFADKGSLRINFFWVLSFVSDAKR